ncbi:MAG TPA: ATP-dependent DNA helicase UvrD2 [Actinomycetota bacterium]|nr:ATP-dependent DNA helicase UvrD2 [Actinomycetota bacterium]
MGGAEEILAGLNDAQRAAASALRGPVAILAGAGTGKTTTITRRIANQVTSGTFPAPSILAVTFTEKAAGELRTRLAGLGVQGVEARTFHAAALSQLGRLWERHTGHALPEILDRKAPLIATLANALPPPHRFLPRGELANEIEWAKNRLIVPDAYLAELDRVGHAPPIPAELMQRVYDGYERRKERTGRIDFEDMLGLAVRLFDDHPAAAATVRQRLHAFTVDEYQDVNLLQQALLDRWLGGRDEVCVVGDDYQTIYTFTGASPEHLLAFPERYPGAAVVRLEENYRSTPEILAIANGLARRLGGFHKELRATRPSGPSPTARALPDSPAEVAFVVAEVRRLHQEGVPFEEMAVLYRINARSEPFEEEFAAAGIPYQVRDGAFLRRPGPRSVLARLRRAEAAAVVEAVELATDAVGYDAEADPDDAEEVTRQADLGRLRSLAAEFAGAHPSGDVAGFVAELSRRFSADRSARGVNLSTFHRAKGLEFDAVFLPRLLDKELPFRSGRATADPEEERRLLYVGLTRAKRHLYLSWPLEPRTQPSPFLVELGVSGPPEAARPSPRSAAPANDGPLFQHLRRWRAERAKQQGVPAYVVFHDATLATIAERRPRDRRDLAGVPGVGPKKLELYADDVLDIVSRAG